MKSRASIVEEELAGPSPKRSHLGHLFDYSFQLNSSAIGKTLRSSYTSTLSLPFPDMKS